jgi:hypothetical protein
MDAARELMKMIKAERFVGNPPKLTSQWIAETVRDFRERLPFASFFSRRPCLGSFAEQFVDAA